MPPHGKALFQHTLGSFSAPKGVERACPHVYNDESGAYAMFQCPEGR